MIVNQDSLVPSEDVAKYLDHKEALPVLKQLISDWEQEIRETESRRDQRYLDLDVEAMRKSDELKADETFIPVRVIDTNIVREHPAYSAFLTQSRRLVTLICQDQTNVDASRLELEVTRGFRYPGWFLQFYRTVDGALTHGWDSIEVVFDPTKPLHVAFEHIGHDNLYFNKKVRNIQESERVIRRYPVTSTKLKSFVTSFGFSQEQVDLICKKDETSKRTDKIFYIYKQFFKFEGVVYVSWFSSTDTNDWLKMPEPLRLGIAKQTAGSPMLPGYAPILEWQDAPIDMYPIHILLYKETEEDCITDKVGRAFLDGDWQEAQSAVVSGYVNGMLRASNVYAAPETGDVEGATVKQTDTELVNGAIYDKPLKFFHTDYPEATVLMALNYFNSAQAQQAGQVDYATMARKDSKKTATELNAAQSEADLLRGTPITLYSEWLRDVFDLSWRIVQSQALQDKISLLRKPVADPMNPALVVFANDKETIGKQFLVLPAGDSDVVARKEKLMQMMQDWPVVSTTPLASRFLADLIRLKYPDVGEEYAQILMGGDVGRGLVQGLNESVKQLVGMMLPGTLGPQHQQQMAALDQQVASYLQPKPQTMPNQ